MEQRAKLARAEALRGGAGGPRGGRGARERSRGGPHEAPLENHPLGSETPTPKGSIELY